MSLTMKTKPVMEPLVVHGAGREESGEAGSPVSDVGPLTLFDGAHLVLGNEVRRGRGHTLTEKAADLFGMALESSESYRNSGREGPTTSLEW